MYAQLDGYTRHRPPLHSDLVLLRARTSLILTSGMCLIPGGAQGEGKWLDSADYVVEIQEMLAATS